MATVFISLVIESIIGSVRRNPFADDPIQLITEFGELVQDERGFELAITVADFNVRDRLNALIADRAGSTIVLRGG
jgi:ABC-type lipopolysaccharide export system ATPase subunit